MRYATLFSGIEAASLAVAPLGWQPAWFAEVDPFCNALLTHRYPDVPNLGDVSAITTGMLAAHGPVDVVIAGFPCQDLSVAGLRGGLAGKRSGLFYEMVRICHELRPTVLVWENVCGLLSSNHGRDFGAVLMAMDQLGFDGAWTSLDAQWFGVAQRRQRIFGVFARRDIGAGRCAEILAFTTRMHGHSPTRRKTGQDIAGTLKSGARSGGWSNSADHAAAGLMVPMVAGTIGGSSQSGGFRTTDLDNNGAYIPFHAHSLNAHAGRHEPTSETLIPTNAAIGQTNRGIATHDIAETVRAGSHGALPMAYQCQGSNVGEMGTLKQGNGHLTGGVPFLASSVALRGREGGATAEMGDDVATALRASSGGGDKAHVLAFSVKDHGADAGDLAPTLRAGGHHLSHANAGVMPAIQSGMAVRRLTPRECERLMGLPDGWTDVPYRGKPAADGNRYKAIGNSIAVPVLAWIARRIDEALT